MCASGLGSQLGREIETSVLASMLTSNNVIHQHTCKDVPGGLMSEERWTEDLSEGTSTEQVSR